LQAGKGKLTSRLPRLATFPPPPPVALGCSMQLDWHFLCKILIGAVKGTRW
jgi:hypothetical protein